jgi:hypothetical protein
VNSPIQLSINSGFPSHHFISIRLRNSDMFAPVDVYFTKISLSYFFIYSSFSESKNLFAMSHHKALLSLTVIFSDFVLKNSVTNLLLSRFIVWYHFRFSSPIYASIIDQFSWFILSLKLSKEIVFLI